MSFNQERSLRALFEDIKKLRARDHDLGRIKAIVISGDIAYLGSTAGFDSAHQFLSQLCSELRVDRRNVIMVPGNHDVDRSAAEAHRKRIAGKGRERTANQKADILFPKFTPFLRFSDSFYEGAISTFTSNRLYSIFDLDRVVIVAFNSCVREGNHHHRCRACQKSGKLHFHGSVGRDQIEQARKDIESRRKDSPDSPPLCIAVVHHHPYPAEEPPPGCTGEHLLEYDKELKYLLAEAGFRLVLHGHFHESKLEQPTTVGTSMPYVFGSGTFLVSSPPNPTENKYLLLDLGPDQSRVIMRKYEPCEGDRLGGWTVDPSINLDGIVALSDVLLPAVQ